MSGVIIHDDREDVETVAAVQRYAVIEDWHRLLRFDVTARSPQLDNRQTVYVDSSRPGPKALWTLIAAAMMEEVASLIR